MLVYGDRTLRLAPRERLLAVPHELAAAAALPAGLARHAALVGLYLEVAGVAQGLLDAALEARGVERLDERAAHLDALLGDWAAEVAASFDRGFSPAAEVFHRPPGAAAAAALLIGPLPVEIQVRVPEGYAFYALYPEAYLLAARRLVTQLGPPEAGAELVVIGLRSIGTGLAPLCAHAARAAGWPARTVTVRPLGPPFARQLSLAPELLGNLLGGEAKRRRFAVVDEGPGLSGSSFGAVGDLLAGAGIPSRNVTYLPGHAGPPGPEAQPRHRARWADARREVVSLDELLLRPGDPRGLRAWLADLGVELTSPVRDLSGGAWRALHFPDRRRWPPVDAQRERRKLLVEEARSGPLLLKFAGLGRHGERAFERSRLLERHGLVVPQRALRHGFLVGDWLADARPLSALDGWDRAALLDGLARYLAVLSTELAEHGPRAGARPGELLLMARYNTQAALGSAYAAELARWEPELPALELGIAPVAIDGRMHAWEWLLYRGRLLKADALDHHADHDCVGTQDVAWDVAGACFELDLDEHEQAILLEQLARRRGRALSPLVLAFYRPCYLAFQLGRHALAAQALAARLPEESERLTRAAAGYARRLGRELAHGPAVVLGPASP